MEGMEDVKASNSIMILKTCTSAREKPSFAFTGLTKRKSQAKVYWSNRLNKIDAILENEKKYSQNATEIDEAIYDLTEHGRMHGTK